MLSFLDSKQKKVNKIIKVLNGYTVNKELDKEYDNIKFPKLDEVGQVYEIKKEYYDKYFTNNDKFRTAVADEWNHFADTAQQLILTNRVRNYNNIQYIEERLRAVEDVNDFINILSSYIRKMILLMIYEDDSKSKIKKSIYQDLESTDKSNIDTYTSQFKDLLEMNFYDVIYSNLDKENSIYKLKDEIENRINSLINHLKDNSQGEKELVEMYDYEGEIKKIYKYILDNFKDIETAKNIVFEYTGDAAVELIELINKK